jgi:thioredoxin-like negative regulator of GroEL
MNTTNRSGTLALAAAALMSAPWAAWAADVKWQPDYATTIKEAARTGKPILLVVGTEACHWCKQLDARSLSDEGVASLLSTRYIVYKLDADREAALANALKVQVYPSLYFASPSGAIVSFQEGFLEPDKLKARLVAVLASVGTPDWMRRDFELAEEAVKAGLPSRALGLLRGIVEDGKARPIQAKAREMLARLEKDAKAESDRAAALSAGGKTAEAIDALKGLDRSYPGTLAAREGKQMLMKLMSRSAEAERERTARAREMLEAARRDCKARNYLTCLDLCEKLAADHPGTDEADEAEKLASEVLSNTEWVREMVAKTAERQAVLLLALADSHARKGEPLAAIRHLEKVLALDPASRHAEAARARLARLKGGPVKE